MCSYFRTKNELSSGAAAIVPDNRFSNTITTTTVGQRIVVPTGSFEKHNIRRWVNRPLLIAILYRLNRC